MAAQRVHQVAWKQVFQRRPGEEFKLDMARHVLLGALFYYLPGYSCSQAYWIAAVRKCRRFRKGD